MMTQEPEQAAQAGDEILFRRDLKEKYGLGAHALRTARRRGLQIRKLGQHSVVLKSELIEYLLRFGR